MAEVTDESVETDAAGSLGGVAELGLFEELGVADRGVEADSASVTDDLDPVDELTVIGGLVLTVGFGPIDSWVPVGSPDTDADEGPVVVSADTEQLTADPASRAATTCLTNLIASTVPGSHGDPGRSRPAHGTWYSHSGLLNLVAANASA